MSFWFLVRLDGEVPDFFAQAKTAYDLKQVLCRKGIPARLAIEGLTVVKDPPDEDASTLTLGSGQIQITGRPLLMPWGKILADHPKVFWGFEFSLDSEDWPLWVELEAAEHALLPILSAKEVPAFLVSVGYRAHLFNKIKFYRLPNSRLKLLLTHLDGITSGMLPSSPDLAYRAPWMDRQERPLTKDEATAVTLELHALGWRVAQNGDGSKQWLTKEPAPISSLKTSPPPAAPPVPPARTPTSPNSSARRTR